MKQLVIATDNFLPRWDGIARFLNEVVPKLVHEYEITILAPMFDKSLHGFNHATVVRFPTFNFELGDFCPAKPPFKKIRKYIKQADIVWIQTIGPIGALAAYYADKYNKSCVGYIHSIEWELVPNSIANNKLTKGIIGFISKIIARYIYNKCDMLMMPTIDVARKFKNNKINAPITIVKLGTNINKFTPPNFKPDAKQALGIESDKKVIGFVGRIAREKDLPTLYRAFTQLQRKRDDVVLLIVGDGVKELMNMFKKRKDVIVTGAKDNVIPYMQAMDIYVLPSLTETTSLTTIEAMSCGCNVVSTKVGRTSEYIDNNENGFFFPARNSFALYKKLQKLLDDDDLRDTISHNARKSVIERFSWQKTIEDIKKVLSSF